MNIEENLKKYAKLIIEVGVHLQKEQYLLIRTPLEGAEFARMLTEYAYKNGAKRVFVQYNDEQVTKLTYTYASEETLSEYPSWMAKECNELAEKGAAFISISAQNPDLLKGIDTKKIATSQKAAGKALGFYRKAIENSNVCWCVVSIPTKSWSLKVFPDMEEEQAVQKLWDTIFHVNRIDTIDPVKEWENHTKKLEKRCNFLNNKKFTSIQYTAPGTNLFFELPENHIWLGGGEHSTEGTYFVANIPTEEVFTCPKRESVTGTLQATKPLHYGGQLIENFSFTFEKGKIVDFTAEKGYDVLKHLIETDDGAMYLGEVAIVPVSSPIATTDVLFYNTLFDENASCHFAVGAAYPINIKDGIHMDDITLREHGLNTSIVHEDFMVGSKELTITGKNKQGEVFTILQNGEWAFEIEE